MKTRFYTVVINQLGQRNWHADYFESFAQHEADCREFFKAERSVYIESCHIDDNPLNDEVQVMVVALA
jgi:hypothetical protein